MKEERMAKSYLNGWVVSGSREYCNKYGIWSSQNLWDQEMLFLSYMLLKWGLTPYH